MSHAPSALNSPEPPSRTRRAWYFAVTLLLFLGALVGQSRLRDQGQVRDPVWDSPVKSGRNAPFITTPEPVVDKMIELGEISPSDLVYDLGCGDGRLVITAATRTGCRGIGIDIDPERVREATERARLHKVDTRVTIRQQDVFQVDFRDADVVLMYLLPWMLEDLLPRFQQCRPGTRLVSHDFQIAGMVPDRSVKVPISDHESRSIHVYDLPLKRDLTQPRRRPPVTR